MHKDFAPRATGKWIMVEVTSSKNYYKQASQVSDRMRYVNGNNCFYVELWKVHIMFSEIRQLFLWHM